MAKYEVKMSCGHTVEVQIYGKEADREKKIAWLEKYGMCTECQKAYKAEKYAELTAQAAEKAVAENLPELTGTEKQINWALTIRAEKLAEVDSFKVKGLKDVEAQAIKNVLASNTEAKFWIDNRDLDAKSIIQANKMVDAIKSEVENLKKAAEEKAEVENNNAVAVEENKIESAKTVATDEKYQITVDADMTIGEIGLHEDTALGEHYSADTKLADVKQSIVYDGDTYIVIDNSDSIEKSVYINGSRQTVYTVPAIKIGSTVDVYKIDGKDFGYLPIYDLCYLVSDNIDWQSPNGAELCTHSIFKVVKDDYNRVCDCTGNATTDDNVDCEEYLQNLMDALGANNGDKVCDDIGYNLGKVFATCQHIINLDKGTLDIYTTKYGGSAVNCALPKAEFAMINKKMQPALKKIKFQNANLAQKLEMELCEVISFLPAELPTKLPVDGTTQSNFVIGYYHQLGKLGNGKFGKISAFVSKTTPVKIAALQSVLNSSRDVIEDLKDED